MHRIRSALLIVITLKIITKSGACALRVFWPTFNLSFVLQEAGPDVKPQQLQRESGASTVEDMVVGQLVGLAS